MTTITVIGTPAPQGSKKAFFNKRSGRAILVESSDKVKPWRDSVVYAAREQAQRIEGPVTVRVVFTLQKPKSAPKGRVTYPDKKPDLSKLLRSTEDALVTAGVIEDDARIVECEMRKTFPNEHALALDVPGAVIQIRRLEA